MAFVKNKPISAFLRQFLRWKLSTGVVDGVGRVEDELGDGEDGVAVVDEVGEDTITACNNAGFALPFTGGTGFTTYILFAALALMAGVYFCKRIEMKENTK